MQTLLILVGVPGSGKSTLAGQLTAASGQWAYINQDTLGDRKRCEEACWAELWAGRDAVVDRCNHTQRQREVWLRLAHDFMRRSGRPLQLLCLALELPVEECKRRAAGRAGHATLAGTDAPVVIERFLSEYEPPAPAEGFHEVHRLTSPEQVHQLLHTRLLPLHGPYLAAAQQQQQGAAVPAWQPQPANGASCYTHPQQAAGWEAAAPVRLAPAWQQEGQQAAWGQGAWGVGSGAVAGLPTGMAQLAELASRPSPSQQQAPGPALAPPEAPGFLQQHGFSTLAPPPGLKLPAQVQKQQREEQRTGQQEAGEASDEVGPNPLQHPRRRRRSRSPSLRPVLPRPPPKAPASPTAGPCSPNSNVVPFGKGWGAAAAVPGSPAAQQPRFLDELDDPRPIVLFDMNGTLTSHTHQRRSTGRNLARPGAHHLRRLASKFRVGVFTSASKRTVAVSLDLLEREAGPGPPIFDRRLVLHRVHTEPVSQEHVQAGGNHWDTVKPLHRHFSKLHRVLLLDDDEYKVLPAEKGNLVHVPSWRDEDPEDSMVRHLVEVLLQVFGSLVADADVRAHTSTAAQMLRDISEGPAAERAQQVKQQGACAVANWATAALNGEEIDIEVEPGHETEEGGGAPKGAQQAVEVQVPTGKVQMGAPNLEEIEIDLGED